MLAGPQPIPRSYSAVFATDRKALGVRVIGEARFVDGTTRPVYLDGERQHVIDEGKRVYGLFIIPEEDRCGAPVIVEEPLNVKSRGAGR